MCTCVTELESFGHEKFFAHVRKYGYKGANVREAAITALYFDVVEAPSPIDPSQTVKYGLRRATVQAFGRAGWKTPMAQFYGIVQDGLISAQHAFRGLNRPMSYENNMEADQTILVYSWAPSIDYEYLGEGDACDLAEIKPSPGKAFVALVREEKIKLENSQTEGTIEKWNWVLGDSELRGAPIDWKIRYAEKLWSR